MAREYDALVVGAGFAGATCAERLAAAGNRVLVIDKRPHIAGNAYDEIDGHGVLIHRYGPHIFHTNGKRIVGDVKRSVSGRVSEEQHYMKLTITRVTGGWMKITPVEPLPNGEYALVEMMGKDGMNLYVWDFGVNPNAAANANPWKPDSNEATKPEAHKAGPPGDAPK